MSYDSVCAFTERILFPKASSVVIPDFADNRAHVDSIRGFLSGADGWDLLSVRIAGSYSPEGKYEFNTKLAKARALALADIVRGLGISVDPVISVVHPKGRSNFMRQRFAEVQIVYRNRFDSIIGNDTVSLVVANQADHDSVAVPESWHGNDVDGFSSDSSADYFTAEQKDVIPLPGVRHRFCDRIFFTTNMLYDAALTPDIGAGISITDRITVLADWMYARWNNRDQRRYWRIYGGDLEARYRIGKSRDGSPLGGHHIGVYGSMACYDFQAGRTHKGVLSDKWNYAVGLSYTYSLPVSTRFNIDFSLGVGYLWGTYKKHRLIDDCDVWLSTHRMGWFGPTRAGVTLVWLLGNSVANNRKGGAR